MKISVILAIYNEQKHLEQCLLSLLSQIEVDFEIIIIDDGSIELIKDLPIASLSDEKVYIYRLEHGGTAKARNFGVSKSKGEIVVFLDGDMYFEPDFLKELVEPIIEGTTMGTYSSQEFVSNWNNVWARCWNFEHGLKSRLRINNKDNMIKDFRAILRKEFERVKGFDDTGYTDTWTLSKKLNYLPSVTKAKYYHYNPDNLVEVYCQAKWIGGRQRKFGLIGELLALIRACFPLSLMYGVIKAFSIKITQFVFFKLVYDFGMCIGILSNKRKK